MITRAAAVRVCWSIKPHFLSPTETRTENVSTITSKDQTKRRDYLLNWSKMMWRLLTQVNKFHLIIVWSSSWVNFQLAALIRSNECVYLEFKLIRHHRVNPVHIFNIYNTHTHTPTRSSEPSNTPIPITLTCIHTNTWIAHTHKQADTRTHTQTFTKMYTNTHTCKKPTPKHTWTNDTY